MQQEPEAAASTDPHIHCVEVHYEDTDMAGIVYYANYLKFIERARSAWVRSLGIDQLDMKDRCGTVFAVRRIEADYLLPARFADQLVIETQREAVSPARIVLQQRVRRKSDAAMLFAARVCLVAIGRHGRAVRLPEALRCASGRGAKLSG